MEQSITIYSKCHSVYHTKRGEHWADGGFRYSKRLTNLYQLIVWKYAEFRWKVEEMHFLRTLRTHKKVWNSRHQHTCSAGLNAAFPLPKYVSIAPISHVHQGPTIRLKISFAKQNGGHQRMKTELHARNQPLEWLEQLSWKHCEFWSSKHLLGTIHYMNVKEYWLSAGCRVCSNALWELVVLWFAT